MKKRFLMLLLASTMLVACGKQETKKEETKESTTKVEEKKKEQKEEKKIGFDGKTVEINDLKIVITETKIIKVGEKGNEYGSKPVIAFWYDTTNKSDKELDPTTAWMAVFSAVQDNSKDMVNELQVASHPDKTLLNTQMAKIKKGGTVKNAVAYELSDDITPVTLKATQGISGKELGKHIFEIKK
ncbi:hypothetical protein HMPREF3181_00884 [Parvimonas sp. KA00067]|uniref:DUF5067 domain-containing protein n=1 Tax=Parvimonas sp. KA00067 TaxID=1588755 RepID=UPI000798D57A|nr:DUF5067 domain-containing protein [Parvimonas sp. KA00067]KXB66139.1 hypothetical protein HMPREF3181_00884 [Parvimonas sp. KA00067]